MVREGLLKGGTCRCTAEELQMQSAGQGQRRSSAAAHRNQGRSEGGVLNTNLVLLLLVPLMLVQDSPGLQIKFRTSQVWVISVNRK